MSFRFITKIGDLEWPWTAKSPLCCALRYFTEFDSFRGTLRKKWYTKP